MENYTPGPTLETYGPNPRTVGIIVVIGGMFCGFAYAIAADVQAKTAWAVFFGMTAVFAGLLLHHLLSRVWVHDSGISFRGLFGYGELCWQDVDRIYFCSYEVHAHWIPLGTFYRLKLVSTHGQKISQESVSGTRRTWREPSGRLRLNGSCKRRCKSSTANRKLILERFWLAAREA